MNFAQNGAMNHARTIRRSTALDAPADVVWAAVGTPQAFRFVTRGMLDWRPVRGRTQPWRQGEESTGWLLLFGVVPFSRHRLRIAEIDDRAHILRSDESGGVIRSWRHDIFVESAGPSTTRYTDVIRIDAGQLTPLVAAFAWVFYRERQRRWRALASVLAGTVRSGDAIPEPGPQPPGHTPDKVIHTPTGPGATTTGGQVRSNAPRPVSARVTPASVDQPSPQAAPSILTVRDT